MVPYSTSQNIAVKYKKMSRLTGLMQLILIPLSAHSRAKLNIKFSTPALAEPVWLEEKINTVHDTILYTQYMWACK